MLSQRPSPGLRLPSPGGRGHLCDTRRNNGRGLIVETDRAAFMGLGAAEHHADSFVAADWLRLRRDWLRFASRLASFGATDWLRSARRDWLRFASRLASFSAEFGFVSRRKSAVSFSLPTGKDGRRRGEGRLEKPFHSRSASVALNAITSFLTMNYQKPLASFGAADWPRSARRIGFVRRDGLASFRVAIGFVRRGELASFGAADWLRSARRIGFVRRGGLASFGAADWLRSARRIGFVRRVGLASFGAVGLASFGTSDWLRSARRIGFVSRRDWLALKVLFLRYDMSFSRREKVAAGRMRAGDSPAFLSKNPSPGLRPLSPGGRGHLCDTSHNDERGLLAKEAAPLSSGWVRRRGMTIRH